MTSRAQDANNPLLLPIVVSAAAVVTIVAVVTVAVANASRAAQSKDTEREAEEDQLSANFVMQEGLPLVKVWVDGQGPVLCVVDTGSCFLNVATEDCLTCNLAQGAIRMNHMRRRRPAAAGPFTPYTIRYGSQTDNAERHDDVAVSLAPWKTARARVRMYATTNRKYSKGYNVLGLASKTRGGAVLPLLAAQPTHALQLEFGEDTGTMSTVRPHAQQLTSFPLCTPVTGTFAGTPRYCVQVNRITVVAPHEQSTSLMACAVVLDTGSNYISMSPDVFVQLKSKLDQNLTLCLHCRNSKTPFMLTWKHYRFGGSPDGPLMVNNKEENPHTILLGAFSLRHSVCVFRDDYFLCAQSQI
jgi:hypothetical protein